MQLCAIFLRAVKLKEVKSLTVESTPLPRQRRRQKCVYVCVFLYIISDIIIIIIIMLLDIFFIIITTTTYSITNFFYAVGYCNNILLLIIIDSEAIKESSHILCSMTSLFILGSTLC